MVPGTNLTTAFLLENTPINCSWQTFCEWLMRKIGAKDSQLQSCDLNKYQEALGGRAPSFTM